MATNSTNPFDEQPADEVNPANPFNAPADSANPFNDAVVDVDNPFNEPVVAPASGMPGVTSAPGAGPGGAVLEFQDFSHSAGYGIAGELQQPGSLDEPAFDDTDQLLEPPLLPSASELPKDAPGASPSTSEDTPPVYSFRFYTRFFDVDTADVGSRIFQAVMPIKGDFLTAPDRPKPELWGPFWIATTLIVMMSICGNLANYLNYWVAGITAEWQYDFTMVTFAVSLVYSYVIVIPVLVWGVFQWIDVPVGLLDLLCLYGYSMFVFVPSAILCIAPMELLRWAVVVVALCMSLAHLLRNLWAPLESARGKSTPVLASIVILQSGLCLMLKLFFFSYAHIASDKPAATPV